MRYSLQLLIILSFGGPVLFAQTAVTKKEYKLPYPALYMQYVDFHIHPTYKHYFKSKSNDEMKEILRSSKYIKSDTIELDTVAFTQALLDKLGRFNWEPATYQSKYRKRKQLQYGEISDLRNYYQASYPELAYVPGSILCNSYSPFEKLLALPFHNRVINNILVTRMRFKRLTQDRQHVYSPFRDFLAEYYYNLSQDKEDTAMLRVPKKLFVWNPSKKPDADEYDTLIYVHHIRMVRDSKELDSILQVNSLVFAELEEGNATNEKGGLFKIITPMVMSIEGGHVLNDSLSGRRKNIKKPFIRGGRERKMGGKKNFHRKISLGNDSCANLISKELFRSVDSLRNLPHRLFFINLGHFGQNHVVGFAKTLDRDPENVQHRLPRALKFLDLAKKKYEGFNYGNSPYVAMNWATMDSIGFKIIDSLTDPAKSKYTKPTYIDIKHLDLRGRLQYYEYRRKLQEKYGIDIPIIASHCAVSGESQGLAMLTGRLFIKVPLPNTTISLRKGKGLFDQHEEIDDPLKFYRKKVKSKKLENRINDLPAISNLSYQSQRSHQIDVKQTYVALDVDTVDARATKDIKLSEEIEIDTAKAGWYYPWSINLYDEEIIEIYKSDGIIGLMFDPRQLGAYMRNYKINNYQHTIEKKFEDAYKQFKIENARVFTELRLDSNDIDAMGYKKSEALIRNWFYIIDLIKKQEEKERYYRDSANYNVNLTELKYQQFVKPIPKNDPQKDPWETVAIGGDFDGLVDPIDLAPTVSYIPLLRTRLVIYVYLFARIHYAEFHDQITGLPLITSIEDSKEKVAKLFYSNGQNFIKKYF